eukprot:4644667-Lingulodinium_polyedra.AAC.1
MKWLRLCPAKSKKHKEFTKSRSKIARRWIGRDRLHGVGGGDARPGFRAQEGDPEDDPRCRRRR